MTPMSLFPDDPLMQLPPPARNASRTASSSSAAISIARPAFQPATNLCDAEKNASMGMTGALGAAERSAPGWADAAYDFLCQFARENEFFISEDVSDKARISDFPQPPTDRAWGSIYRRALRSNVIIQSGSGRSRRRHGSICPRWQSRVYAGSAIPHC